MHTETSLTPTAKSALERARSKTYGLIDDISVAISELQQNGARPQSIKKLELAAQAARLELDIVDSELELRVELDPDPEQRIALTPAGAAVARSLSSERSQLGAVAEVYANTPGDEPEPHHPSCLCTFCNHARGLAVRHG